MVTLGGVNVVAAELAAEKLPPQVLDQAYVNVGEPPATEEDSDIGTLPGAVAPIPVTVISGLVSMPASNQKLRNARFAATLAAAVPSWL